VVGSSFDPPSPHIEKSGVFRPVCALRLVSDTAALPNKKMAVSCVRTGWTSVGSALSEAGAKVSLYSTESSEEPFRWITLRIRLNFGQAFCRSSFWPFDAAELPFPV